MLGILISGLLNRGTSRMPQNLAAQVGLPNLREFALGRYIVLYAHAETEVVLLVLKHQRQLVYFTEE